MNWVLAVDLGNGGPKVAAVEESGQILATAFTPVSVHHGRDGTATQDAIEWEVALRDAVARVIADVPFDGLTAVGITGQWGSTVPVDDDGNPAGPVILWSDTRSRDNVRRLLGGPVNVGGYARRKCCPGSASPAGRPARPAPTRPGIRCSCRTNCPKSERGADCFWNQLTTLASC